MLIGLINRNNQLHIGVVPQNQPETQIRFKLYWMEESDPSLNLNLILDFTTNLITEHEAYSINTKEEIKTNKTEYTTKYVLSYVINGEEKFTWYKRTDGLKQNISDATVNTALYNFLKIPGVENAKNSKGGWNSDKQMWFIHKDPRGLPTIGYGHLITNSGNNTENFYSNGISDATALNLLESDVNDHVNHAKDIMGGCWSELDFWAKVLYAELVYNIGKGSAKDKYPNFKASLIQKNYGTPENLNDPPAPKNSKTGVAFREFKRNYKDPNTGELKPCVGRHKHIIRHILIKLVAFKKTNSSTQNLQNTELCVNDEYNETTDNGFTFADSLNSDNSILENELAEMVNEKTCKYLVNLNNQNENINIKINVKQYEGECVCPYFLFEKMTALNVSTCRGEDYGGLEIAFKHDIVYEILGQETFLTSDKFKSNKYNFIITLDS
jgi:hypothetical protein